MPLSCLSELGSSKTLSMNFFLKDGSLPPGSSQQVMARCVKSLGASLQDDEEVTFAANQKESRYNQSVRRILLQSLKKPFSRKEERVFAVSGHKAVGDRSPVDVLTRVFTWWPNVLTGESESGERCKLRTRWAASAWGPGPPDEGPQDGGSQILEKSLGIPVPERDEIALGGEDPVRDDDMPMRMER